MKILVRRVLIVISVVEILVYFMAISVLYFSGQTYFLADCLQSQGLGQILRVATTVSFFVGAILGPIFVIWNVFYGLDRRFACILSVYVLGLVLLFFFLGFHGGVPPVKFDLSNGDIIHLCGPKG